MKRYLDLWTAERIGADSLTRENLEAYQLKKLKETVDHAIKNSRFYEEKLADFSAASIGSFDDFHWLPFTRPDELSERGEEMVCVSAGDISRIVTLETGGSSGIPKRIFFTEADQELTVDFFHHGMQFLLDERDKLLILMPYRRPGSVGDLLRRGVERLGAEVHCLGLIDENLSFNTILDTIYKYGITSITALPTQAHQLMKHTTQLNLETVLLSAEYVSPSVVRDLEEIWNCRVFEHYGMTEMGLGGAVSCGRGKGYHIREGDLYIEIMDPSTGEILPDGKWGEVVFTTLNREGMPFIRYRTGDESRVLNEACPCGSVLRRLDRVKNRNLKKGWLE